MRTSKRSISDAVWRRHFTSPTGNYDGDHFEKLSLAILTAEFGGDWQPTARSYDGNKDFVLQLRNQTIWAESKAYAKTLTYHVVSPTLFMALIGEPEAVVFVSRSKIHPRSKRYLAQFQRRTGKRIITLDGDTLDRVIIANQEIASRFFPSEQLVGGDGAGVRVFTSRTPDVTVYPRGATWGARASTYMDLSSTDESQVPTIGVGELLRVDLAIVNEGLHAARGVRARLVPWRKGASSPFKLEWFCDQESEVAPSFNLGVGEIRQTTAFFRGADPAKGAYLPHLEIDTGFGKQRVSLGRASVSPLYRIGLVGRMNNEIVRECREAARSRRRSWVLQVEGGSGIGKTRLLQEIAGEFATAGFDVHSIDKEFYEPQKSEEVLRRLLAQINNLPLISEAAEGLPGGATAADNDLVTRMIFATDCPERRQPSMVADVLLQSMAGRKTALIVDNVQNFDDDAASTLDALLTRLKGSEVPNVVLILAFNTDLRVDGSGAEMLRRRLTAVAESFTSEATVKRRELPAFSDIEADEFFHRAVAASDSALLAPAAYPQTMQAFRRFVPRNPLHMWETLRWLRDKGVLRLRNGLLVVGDSDDSALAALLVQVPPDLEALMDRRWHEVKEASDRGHTRDSAHPSGVEIANATCAACYLGPASRRQYAACDVRGPALDRLVHVGILAEGGFGDLRFVHQRIFRYFQKRFDSIATSDAAALAAGLKRLRLAENRFESFFILSVHAGANRRALLKRTCALFLERGATHEFFERFLSLLVDELVADDHRLDETSLRVFIKACSVMQAMKSMRSGYDLIHRCFMEKVVSTPATRLSGRALFEFNRQHVNAALSVADDSAARDLVEDAIRKLDRSRFESDRDLRIALGSLLDRKASLLKSFGSQHEALEIGQQALSIARSEGDRWLEIELLSNMAGINISLRQAVSIDEGVRMYSSALALFDQAEERWNMSDPVPVRSFVNRARIHLRNADWQSLTLDAERGVQFADGRRNGFWGARLGLLAAAGRLLAFHAGHASYDDVLAAIWRAQDTINVYGANRDAWALPYLAGKAAILAGKPATADDLFRQALETIGACDPDGRILYQRAEVPIDIAVCARRNGLSIHRAIPDLMNHPYVAAECRAVVQLPEPAFEIYVREWGKSAYCSVDRESLPPLTLVLF
ncbi:MAG: hypothetical protein JWM27_3842 [Gemmatimonadetes bacterium]|nr:hypothetical protein [Gemmatimonadota bacterium]